MAYETAKWIVARFNGLKADVAKWWNPLCSGRRKESNALKGNIELVSGECEPVEMVGPSVNTNDATRGRVGPSPPPIKHTAGDKGNTIVFNYNRCGAWLDARRQLDLHCDMAVY